ncbi:MAG: SEC-C metal-binding domain-containing protein, partial [Pseudomonadota bacterium]
ESQIIVQAGVPGTVTIATNMAGRGTDIVLGGNVEAQIDALGDEPDQAKVNELKGNWKEHNQQVLEAGGLHIIGTERHESRRIDNQLRGRAGRQGDPGSTRFYLSLEDSLMRIFASDRVRTLMQKLGMEEGESIEHPWVTKAIENAQRKVESHNFDIRKNLLEYDDVANDQRKVTYEQRSELMGSDDISENIEAIRFDVIESIIDTYIAPNSMEEQWDVAGLESALHKETGLELPIQEWLDSDDKLYEEPLRNRIHESVMNIFTEKEALLGNEMMLKMEKDVMLQVLDAKWKEHLAAMDYLRQSIGLRGYAQKNPKQEYKREAFAMFEQMLEEIKHDTVSFLCHVKFQSPQEVTPLASNIDEANEANLQMQHAKADDILHPQQKAQQNKNSQAQADDLPKAAPVKRTEKKVGRNEPCPCGSGKKYKQCHGKLT